MLLELGPVPTDAVCQWSKFARRVLVELRLSTDELNGLVSDDQISGWAELVDRWDDHAASSDDDDFRWSGTLDTEMAEYLLHGLDQLLHSDQLKGRFTTEEVDTHWSFTLAILQAFVDGLSVEGRCHEHYVDQVRAHFKESLDH